VTLAGWLIMVGSVAVVVLVFDRLTGLHTLETREAVESFLDRPPGSDLDLGVNGAITIIRTLGMIAAGCATAAAILGYQVLRRNRAARLLVTVLAVPLFFAGMVTGGFIPAVIAASTLMLWLQPARTWFSDEPAVREAPRPVAPVSPVPPVQQPVHQELPPHHVWPAPYVGPDPVRPPAVVWACILSWVTCGLTAVGVLLTGVAFGLEPDLVIDEARKQSPELSQQGITDTMLIVTTYALLGFVLLWCIAGAVLAVLTYRRVAWARIVLVVSASVAAAISLLGSAMGGFLLVLPLAAAVVCVALLLRPDVRPWLDATGRNGPSLGP
jgi:hypothetical protein